MPRPRPAASAPFVAVNCATSPEGVAERLLFGTKRGAYSGADADAEGYVQAAHEGTLFLDEIAVDARGRHSARLEQNLARGDRA